MIKIETLASSIQNHKPLMNSKMKTFSNDRSIYYFGGVNNGVESNVAFEFNRDLNRFIGLPELPDKNKDLFLYVLNDSVYISSNGAKYMLENNEWVHVGNTSITKAYPVFKGQYVYLVTNGVLYRVTDSNTFSFVDRSDNFIIEDYIPSTGSDFIYFVKNKYDLNNKVFINNESELSTNLCIHNGTEFEIHDDCVTVVTKDGYIFDLDHNNKQLSYQLLYENAPHPHNTSADESIQYAYEIIGLEDNNLYFTSNHGNYHTIKKLDTQTLSSDILLTKRIESKSFSERPLYNHTNPNGIVVDGSPILIGSDGFYRDNSKFDNSLYFNNNTIKLSVNKNNIGLLNYGDGIGLVGSDDESTVFYHIDMEGNVITERSLLDHGDKYKAVLSINDNIILWKYPATLYINYEEMIYEADGDIIGLCADKYHAYYIIRNGDIEIHKVAHYSRTPYIYKTNMVIDTLKDIKTFNDRLYIIYENNNETNLDRIFING